MEFVTIGTVHLIQLACLLSFLCLTKADHPVYVSCSNEKNYTVGSQYQANVNLTLNALATNASLKGFYNTTSGDYPDRVYGLIQCRADVSTKDCLGWADKLTSETYKRCSQQKEVFIAYHLGLVHYSNNNFLSKPFSHPQERYNWGGIASDRDKFNQKLGGLMANLSMIASYLPSKFSRGMTDVTDFINVYGMVECTRDLNQLACSQCLQGMRNSIPTDGHQGGLFLSVTCYVRYDIYPFEHSPSVGTPPRLPTLPDKTDSSYGKTVWMIVIISLAASVVGALSVIFVYLRFMNRTREERNDISKESQLKLSHQLKSLEFFLIHLNVIKAATDNFSAANKLGQGGFGPVYKGMLHDGTKVAVKRLSTTSGQGLKEFKNEIILISKLQHKNLVRLLGCCIENGENLLVYEYLPNSSLDVSLFDPIKRAQLDWTRRFNIILGIARGLLYLHEDSQLRVIHRDLKASNVLLDNEMNPKISDFGIARMFEGNQTRANTNRVVGTYGYMAPEYAMGGLISTKSDVYSFGVLVLEIISGKRTSSINDSECPQCLTGYAWRLWSEGESLGLMDPILIKSHVCNEVLKCIHVGLLCVQDDPVDRPSMSGVVVMLRGDSIILEQPTQPAFSRKSVGAASGQSPQHAKARSKNNLTI